MLFDAFLKRYKSLPGTPALVTVANKWLVSGGSRAGHSKGSVVWLKTSKLGGHDFLLLLLRFFRFWFVKPTTTQLMRRHRERPLWAGLLQQWFIMKFLALPGMLCWSSSRMRAQRLFSCSRSACVCVCVYSCPRVECFSRSRQATEGASQCARIREMQPFLSVRNSLTTSDLLLRLSVILSLPVLQSQQMCSLCQTKALESFRFFKKNNICRWKDVLFPHAALPWIIHRVAFSAFSNDYCFCGGMLAVVCGDAGGITLDLNLDLYLIWHHASASVFFVCHLCDVL